MKLTLADVLHEHWESYAIKQRSHLSSAHYRAVRAVLSCRTPAMGGHLYQCSDCQKKHYAYHSCNHRSCPQCGAHDQALWSAKQEARLLPVPYFMITFTLPAQLRQACIAHPKELYQAILKESAAALKDLIATKHHGAEIGFTSILHTWGRQIQHHSHIHIIVPAAGYDRKTDTVIQPKKSTFLIHYRPLAQRFRNRLRQALQNLTLDNGNLLKLSPEATRSLSPATTWNVQVKHVGKGATALRYLARYVHRSAFHPKRLLGYDKGGNIRLQWTCSNTGKSSILTLHPHEFIRRWLIHALPKGFARIRHYGYLSAAALKTRLRIRAHLGQLGESPPQLPELEPFCCDHCGSALQFLRKIIKTTQAPRPPPSRDQARPSLKITKPHTIITA